MPLRFPDPATESAQQALDTILQRPVRGIPLWMLNIMEHRHIDRIANMPPGSYRHDPETVYLAMQRRAGVCLLDQYIPTNPLTMGDEGYEPGAQARQRATSGVESIVLDGIAIDSPEAVVAHMEAFVFPRLRQAIAAFDADARVQEIIDGEIACQQTIGPHMLKSGYAFAGLPKLRYGQYGYSNYLMAFALYPEVMEQDFALQADHALVNNQAAARAYREAGLPPLYRLDHDMADSTKTLVRLDVLDRIWFPHLARCLAPLLQAGVKLIWHCDGNLMAMIPRLLEVGLAGFQGFQYEDGMDYERICTLKTHDGDDLIVIAGVSVTRTLPLGSADDVKREIDWLVRHGPPTGLFLGASSSITPGVPWANMASLLDGLAYYRTYGRPTERRGGV